MSTAEAKPVAWPLLFVYRGPVFGNGFLAEVDLCGKLLASPETDGIWLNGVNPGAFALGAVTLAEANRSLRDALTRVLVDFAEASDSFLTFRTLVERFYNETDPDTAQEWTEAVSAVKSGLMPLPEGLIRNPPGWQCGVQVREKSLAQLTPNDNRPLLDTRQLAAAA